MERFRSRRLDYQLVYEAQHTHTHTDVYIFFDAPQYLLLTAVTMCCPASHDVADKRSCMCTTAEQVPDFAHALGSLCILVDQSDLSP